MDRMKTIAVYVPYWLYRNDVGITIFVKGLYRSIKESKKYNLLKLNPRLCKFKSKEEAEAFAKKYNLALVIYHGSRVLENKNVERGLDLLEEVVPFLNTKKVHIADDKIATKELLREINIPVLAHTLINNKNELFSNMVEGDMYVAKPHDKESGYGVKLIKKIGLNLFEHKNKSWRKMKVKDSKSGLAIYTLFLNKLFFMIIVFVLGGLIYFFLKNDLTNYIIIVLLSIVIYLLFKLEDDYIYKPLMLEEFYGDNTDEFYCLRSTVIGDEVVESAKKANTKNVTPNISHGGIATKIELTEEQKKMAINATKAVGATYSGVDFLVKNGKTVVCEVNVGPIGLYCEQTGVDVGKKLGEYAIQQVDSI